MQFVSSTNLKDGPAEDICITGRGEPLRVKRVRSNMIGHPDMYSDELVQYAVNAASLDEQARLYVRNLHLQQATVASVRHPQPRYTNHQPVCPNHQSVYPNHQSVYPNHQPVYSNQQPVYPNADPVYPNPCAPHSPPRPAGVHQSTDGVSQCRRRVPQPRTGVFQQPVRSHNSGTTIADPVTPNTGQQLPITRFRVASATTELHSASARWTRDRAARTTDETSQSKLRRSRHPVQQAPMRQLSIPPPSK